MVTVKPPLIRLRNQKSENLQSQQIHNEFSLLNFTRVKLADQRKLLHMSGLAPI